MADYQWFIEPHNDHTNEAIATALAQTDLSDTIEEVRDKSGRLHKVFLVDHPIIRRFRQDAATDTRLQFTVFNRTRNYGPVRIPPDFSKRSSAGVRRGPKGI